MIRADDLDRHEQAQVTVVTPVTPVREAYTYSVRQPIDRCNGL